MKRALRRELSNYIDELAFRGRRIFLDLAPDEVEKILAILSEIDEGGVLSRLLCDKMNSLFTTYLLTESREDGEEVLEYIREIMIEEYKEDIEDMLKDAYEIMSADMSNPGNRPFFDEDYQDRVRDMRENLS